MSENEKMRTIRHMEAFEQQMKAKGVKPSKTWLAAKRSVGSLIINDQTIL